MSDYTNMMGVIRYREPVRWQHLDALAENDQHVKENAFEDATATLFFQAAAPTGWTKQTTHSGKAIRVVNTAGGTSGGSADPATAITLAHTHTIASQAAHDHDLTAHTHSWGRGSSGDGIATGVFLGIDGSDFLRGMGGGSDGVVQGRLDLSGGPYTTNATGSHDHGGATDSKLSDVTLAHADVIICTKNSVSGYTDKTVDFARRNKITFQDFDELGDNDVHNAARLVPSGSVSVFGSASAPTGWTKVTTTHGKLLRVTSGSGGGTGGSHDPQDVITLAHDHATFTAGGSHSHSIPNHVHRGVTSTGPSTGTPNGKYVGEASGVLVIESGSSSASRTAYKGVTDSSGSGTSSTQADHQHDPAAALSDVTLAHLNVIICSKDSGGAPGSYSALGSFFSDENLLAWQDGEQLAANDAYCKYHLVPQASIMFFFQANAPTSWTKKVDNNGRLLRVVSGLTGLDGGTTGGSHDPATQITLAHTHTIPAHAHTHTLTHGHALGSGTVTANAFTIGLFGQGTIQLTSSFASLRENVGGGASSTKALPSVDNATVTTDSDFHDHGGATGSALTSITLAHVDVLACQKN